MGCRCVCVCVCVRALYLMRGLIKALRGFETVFAGFLHC